MAAVDREDVCLRCAGTGLVCGHEPVISPGACCVDYANALCPECGGSGRKTSETGDSPPATPTGDG
jgi:DnaJ-class molecular chaperone